MQWKVYKMERSRLKNIFLKRIILKNIIAFIRTFLYFLI